MSEEGKSYNFGSMGYGFCEQDLVQLEMVGEVPEIESGGRVAWSTRGKQRFIHRDINALGFGEGYQIASYHAVAGFDCRPYAIQFHQSSPNAICILESVKQKDQEQLMGPPPSCGFEIFSISEHDPIVIAWPIYTQDRPLEFSFHNPLDQPLLSFYLSLHVTAPKDFANRWIKEGAL